MSEALLPTSFACVPRPPPDLPHPPASTAALTRDGELATLPGGQAHESKVLQELAAQGAGAHQEHLGG